MSKRQIIMILGFVVIIIPFLGFGYSINTTITIIIGISIIAVSYNIKPIISINDERPRDDKSKSKNDLPYVESINDNPTSIS